MKNFSTFIGMDVHKETIAVATAGKHGSPRYYGAIANRSSRQGCESCRVKVPVPSIACSDG